LLLFFLACSDDGQAPAPDAFSPDGPALDRGTVDLAAPDLKVSPDQFVPFELELTVNDIPLAMNGSQPFTNLSGKPEPFRLALPRHGFALDVRFRGSAARPDTLELTASTPLGAFKAGANLASKLASVGPGKLRWLVPPGSALPEGEVTFSAKMSDGTQTLTSTLAVDVHEKTFLLDPFRLVDEWLLVFSQDLYAVGKSSDTSGKITVKSTPGANGIPDFDEDLRLIGFGTAKMLPAAAAAKNLGVVGTNAIMVAWVQREMVQTLRSLFRVKPDGTFATDSVRIRFVMEGSPGAPAVADYQHQVLKGGETKKSFSAIGIGGGDTAKPYLGYSKSVDHRNVQNEDNLAPDAGVFTTKAIGLMLELLTSDPGFKALFGLFFGEVLPELGGTPVGEHSLDAEILAAGFDPKSASPDAANRHKKLTFLVENLGRLAGALTAHEIGHSLGLVASGPPPHGLFGGESEASFVFGPRTTKVHIDTPGFNVMEAGPGSAPGVALQPARYLTMPAFNELNLAYLQGRVLLLPPP
jgi:hypothetical protein